jgi:hypothetical protein
MVTQEKIKEMSKKDPDRDDDDNDDVVRDHDLEGFITWKMLPPIITVVIAVGAVMASFYTSMSEFKVRDMEIGSKVQYLEQRIEKIEQNMSYRVNEGQADRRDLRNEVDTIKELLGKIEQRKR